MRAWLQFLTGVPVQRPEEMKAKTFFAWCRASQTHRKKSGAKAQRQGFTWYLRVQQGGQLAEVMSAKGNQ